VLDREALVGDLLPTLAGSGYGDATVGQVADMTVAVGYGEDYGDAQAGPSAGRHATFGDYIAALAPGTPVPLRALLARIGHGDRPHGEAFAYATPDTDVLGWLVEEARGRPYVEVLRATIWDHVGPEHDGGMTLTPDGVPLLAAGLLVTTRDLARAGQFLLDRLAADTAAGPGAGEGLLPGSVVESMRDGDTATFQRGGRYAYLDGYAYRDQWWLPGGPHRPLSAWGIHGQLLWVDPEAGLVVALHSAGRSPSDGRRDLDHDALCRTLTSLSAGWPTPA
jgi:CubicO group peptidase (beta-lactamase class C family)